jgi:hypothetical protein
MVFQMLLCGERYEVVYTETVHRSRYYQSIISKVVVKLSLCLTKHYVMKTCGGVGVQIRVLLTPALVGGELSASCPGHFTPAERTPGTRWTEG